nr:hypothetical protein [Tanacetum cinerariifolium]
MLWGIITHTNIDYAKLMWEEFIQAIKTFLIDKANLGSPTKKGKKTKPHVIPYSRFTKLILYYLGRQHNIHQRSGSPLNLAEDDLSLGNLKFVPKGEINKVFGMKIPEELITDNIKNVPYYNAYLEMVANHEREIAAVKEGGKKKTTPKANKPVKPAPAKQAKPATAKQPKPKPVKEKPTKPTPIQKAGKGKVIKARTRRTPATEEASTGPSAQPQDDTSANIVRETPSPTDAEYMAKLDEGQAGSDPGKTLESRTPPDDDKMDEDQAGSDPGKIHVALAGPNPEPMHDDFVATVYPKVHEILKFLADEHVILEDLPSSSETLSSMKNLDDTYTFGDQLFNKNQPKMKLENRMLTLKLYPCANSSAGASEQLSSGNSFALTVAKYSSSGIFITGSGNDLEHFIPNNPPLNLMLHLQSSFQN